MPTRLSWSLTSFGIPRIMALPLRGPFGRTFHRTSGWDAAALTGHQELRRACVSLAGGVLSQRGNALLPSMENDCDTPVFGAGWLPPTKTLYFPGCTLRLPWESTRLNWRGWSVKRTSFVAPGARWTREKPSSE